MIKVCAFVGRQRIIKPTLATHANGEFAIHINGGLFICRICNDGLCIINVVGRENSWE